MVLLRPPHRAEPEHFFIQLTEVPIIYPMYFPGWVQEHILFLLKTQTVVLKLSLLPLQLLLRLLRILIFHPIITDQKFHVSDPQTDRSQLQLQVEQLHYYIQSTGELPISHLTYSAV